MIKSRILLENFTPYENALVFDNWSDFISKCNSIKNEISSEEACSIVGLSIKLYEEVTSNAFYAWRDSTTTSTLHSISYLKLGVVPPTGNAIFKDLLWQTRFITIAISNSLRRLSYHIFAKRIVKDKKAAKVNNTDALTVVDDNSVKLCNDIIRCLYLQWYIHSLMKVKLPKLIYRGIRASDLYSHPTLEPVVAAIFKSDKTYDMKRKHAIDILIQWICDKKLHEITDGNILSFTASIPIAKYFSKGEGFILVVDPKKVDIVNSELHDPRMAGKDDFNGKNEREYIVRIPEDYAFTKNNIIINDEEYYIAEENPLAVALFGHDDKLAKYELNGKNIEAYFSWNSAGDGGSVIFKVPNDEKFAGYGYNGRGNFRKLYGFDPLPTESNLVDIKNFKILPRKQW